jgi:hypothetical protein
VVESGPWPISFTISAAQDHVDKLGFDGVVALKKVGKPISQPNSFQFVVPVEHKVDMWRLPSPSSSPLSWVEVNRRKDKRGKPCSICFNFGHLASACKEAPKCWRCAKPASDCPDGNCSSGSPHCGFCNTTGHLSMHCSEYVRPREPIPKPYDFKPSVVRPQASAPAQASQASQAAQAAQPADSKRASAPIQLSSLPPPAVAAVVQSSVLEQCVATMELWFSVAKSMGGPMWEALQKKADTAKLLPSIRQLLQQGSPIPAAPAFSYASVASSSSSVPLSSSLVPTSLSNSFSPLSDPVDVDVDDDVPDSPIAPPSPTHKKHKPTASKQQNQNAKKQTKHNKQKPQDVQPSSQQSQPPQPPQQSQPSANNSQLQTDQKTQKPKQKDVVPVPQSSLGSLPKQHSYKSALNIMNTIIPALFTKHHSKKSTLDYTEAYKLTAVRCLEELQKEEYINADEAQLQEVLLRTVREDCAQSLSRLCLRIDKELLSEVVKSSKAVLVLNLRLAPESRRPGRQGRIR